MKKLITVIVLVIGILSLYAQTTTTYEVLKNGMVQEKQTLQGVAYDTTLTFAEGVPKTLNLGQIAELLKKGSVEISRKVLQGEGVYSHYLLYFTPKVEVQNIKLQNGIVTLEPKQVMPLETILSWWYILGMTSVILMTCSYFLNKTFPLAAVLVAIAAIAALVAAAAIVALVVAAAIVALVVAAVAVAVAVAIVALVEKDDNWVSIFYVIYLGLVIIFFVLCYFQI